MTPKHEDAPSLETFNRLAATAFANLPEAFRQHCDNLLIRVAEEADRETLDEMGIKDPLTLTGLFEGVAQTEDSITAPYEFPNQVWLYRRPILEELRDRAPDGVTLEALISHVLVHEIGHHFGLSDADMHAIEAAAASAP